MQYLGGKSRLGGRIVAAMIADSKLDPRRTLAVDACCGGLSVSVAMAKAGFRRVVALDARPALVTMWRAAVDGWEPPSSLSEAEYRRLRERDDPDDPRTAFAMFGCSFAGKPWGGYARSKREVRNFAAVARRSILRKVAALRATRFEVHLGRYEDFKTRRGGLMYADPPYAGTTGYRLKFTPIWPTARRWARDGAAAVYVSEYRGPSDGGATEVWNAAACSAQLAKPGTLERLFKVAPPASRA